MMQNALQKLNDLLNMAMIIKDEHPSCETENIELLEDTLYKMIAEEEEKETAIDKVRKYILIVQNENGDQLTIDRVGLFGSSIEADNAGKFLENLLMIDVYAVIETTGE